MLRVSGATGSPGSVFPRGITRGATNQFMTVYHRFIFSLFVIETKSKQKILVALMLPAHLMIFLTLLGYGPKS
jgi:hypothetical protein